SWIDSKKRVTLFHILTLCEMDLRDHAAGLCPDGYRRVSLDATSGIELHGQILLHNGCYGDGHCSRSSRRTLGSAAGTPRGGSSTSGFRCFFGFPRRIAFGAGQRPRRKLLKPRKPSHYCHQREKPKKTSHTNVAPYPLVFNLWSNCLHISRSTIISLSPFGAGLRQSCSHITYEHTSSAMWCKESQHRSLL